MLNKYLLSPLIILCCASPVLALDSGLILDDNVTVRAIVFPDGTAQTTANLTGAQGIQGIQGEQGIQGIQGEQGAPAPVSPERLLYINRLSIAAFVPMWFTQGNSWTRFNPDFMLTFNKTSDTSILRVSWSDNVGIYNASWCNIGLFVDNVITSGCTGSWSGINGITVFNQQNISCVLSDIPSGLHTLYVQHRSQYCVYGNYAFDNQGSNRFISVEEQN